MEILGCHIIVFQNSYGKYDKKNQQIKSCYVVHMVIHRDGVRADYIWFKGKIDINADSLI